MLHSTIKQYTKLGSANSFMQGNYHSIIIPNAGNFFPAITPYKCTSCCTQCVIHTYILYISTSLFTWMLSSFSSQSCSSLAAHEREEVFQEGLRC